MTSRLTPILDARRAFVAKAKAERPLAGLMKRVPDAPATRGFRDAIRKPGLTIIA